MLIRILAAIGVLSIVLGCWGLVTAYRIARGTMSAGDDALVETIARKLRSAALHPDDRDRKDRIGVDEADRARARHDWAELCASCHGADGSGYDTIGARMYPRAPNLAAKGTQSLTDGELYWIIENGIGLSGMPGFGDDARENPRNWRLVAFIRELPTLSVTDHELIKSLMKH